ncbi:hypothetical protein L9H26_06250 [Morganella psychrotolerans]|uniref:hypothetical protein n=1 Tax=Morganella psychrotolerans TaxID=368603 RepID=UPI000A95829C|nr:hypothetical protein [Morganella psychrotolerans]
MHPLVDKMIAEIVGTARSHNEEEVDVSVQESYNRVQIQVNIAEKPVMDIILNLNPVT